MAVVIMRWVRAAFQVTLCVGGLGGCSSADGARMGIVTLEGEDEVRAFSQVAESWGVGTAVLHIKSEIQRMLRQRSLGDCLYWGRFHLGGSGSGEFVVLLSTDLQIACFVDHNDVLLEPARVEKRRRWTILPDGTWTPADD